MLARKTQVTKSIQERAQAMHSELLERKLEVVLAPAPEQRHTDHYIRMAVNQPPQWFSEFARRYMRSGKRERRLRPNFIKRRETLRALERLSEGQADTVYAQRWLREIKRQLANELEQVPF